MAEAHSVGQTGDPGTRLLKDAGLGPGEIGNLELLRHQAEQREKFKSDARR